MSFKVEATGSNTTFSFTITFINAIETGKNKVLSNLRKEFVKASQGLFDVTLDMNSINSKVEFAYKMIRREFNLLLDDISLYINENVLPTFFDSTPNEAGRIISLGIAGTTFTWEPLKKNTIYKKKKYGGSPFQKYYKENEFKESLQALRGIGAPGKIEIIIGFFGVDSGKVLANEFGTVKGQPARPILEPIYDALYQGTKEKLLPWLRKYNRMPDSTHHSIILALREFREAKYYKSWFRVA